MVHLALYHVIMYGILHLLFTDPVFYTMLIYNGQPFMSIPGLRAQEDMNKDIVIKFVICFSYRIDCLYRIISLINQKPEIYFDA